MALPGGNPTQTADRAALARLNDLRSVSFNTFQWWEVGDVMTKVATFDPPISYVLEHVRLQGPTRSPEAFWIDTIIGFSDNPAAYASGGSTGTLIARSLAEGYLAPQEPEHFELGDKGFYLPTGKKVYVLQLIQAKDIPLWHGSVVTLFLSETFEQV